MITYLRIMALALISMHLTVSMPVHAWSISDSVTDRISELSGSVAGTCRRNKGKVVASIAGLASIAGSYCLAKRAISGIYDNKHLATVGIAGLAAVVGSYYLIKYTLWNPGILLYQADNQLNQARIAHAALDLSILSKEKVDEASKQRSIAKQLLSNQVLWAEQGLKVNAEVSDKLNKIQTERESLEVARKAIDDFFGNCFNRVLRNVKSIWHEHHAIQADPIADWALGGGEYEKSCMQQISNTKCAWLSSCGLLNKWRSPLLLEKALVIYWRLGRAIAWLGYLERSIQEHLKKDTLVISPQPSSSPSQYPREVIERLAADYARSLPSAKS